MKTFAGLKLAYIIRHFIFGLCIGVFMYLITRNYFPASSIISIIINTLLYPYSRFIYEYIVEFFIGENSNFFVEIKLFLIVKVITIYLCWAFAMVIAPLGLIFLYFYHTKQEKNNTNQLFMQKSSLSELFISNRIIFFAINGLFHQVYIVAFYILHFRFYIPKIRLLGIEQSIIMRL